MRTLKVTYTEGGTDYQIEILLSTELPSPLKGGEFTIQSLVAAVDSVVTGIVR